MTEAATTSVEPGMFDRRYRLPLAGVVVVMTVVAIEAMAVATIMPTVARDLHGLRYYSWGFTVFLLADVVGMVDAGRHTDRRGPGPTLLGGLGFFAAGLVVASLAPDMGVFLVGRVLQGLGSGSMIVAMYVLVGRAFPESLHPRVFALLSTAWVVPSLVGPALAGVVTTAVGWRWVFGGIAPLAIAGAALLIPVIRSLPPSQGSMHPTARPSDGLLLAAALGLLQLATQLLDWRSAPLAVLGIALGAKPLLRLLPDGALRLKRGLPTVVALRGILTCAFFGAEAYLPLTLTRVHGGSARVVGIPLTLAALGWAAGSWWQGHGSADRSLLLPAGYALVAAAVASLIAVDISGTSLWLAAPIWLVAGAGIGIAITVLSVLVLELSPPEEQGANSAAFQICDIVGTTSGIAAVGALITGFGLRHLTTATVIADAGLAAVAALGVLATRRAGLARD